MDVSALKSKFDSSTLKPTRMLKQRYQDRESCQWAARGAVAGIAADALDNIVPTSRATSAIDGITGLAIMRCAGMSMWNIVFYYLSLLVIGVLGFLLVWLLIPSSIFDNCKVCTDSEQVYSNGKTKTVCKEYRDGTASECETGGRIFRGILGFVAALLIVTLVHAIVVFGLKARIFTTTALMVDVGARAIL